MWLVVTELALGVVPTQPYIGGRKGSSHESGLREPTAGRTQKIERKTHLRLNWICDHDLTGRESVDVI